MSAWRITNSAFVLVVWAASVDVLAAEPLAGTQPLDWEGDLASRLVEGVDQFAMRQIVTAGQARDEEWHAAAKDPQTYPAFLDAKRKRLAEILGATDPLDEPVGFELLATTERSSVVHETDRVVTHRVRWPVFRNVHGEGLLLEPKVPAGSRGSVIVLPSVHQSPEMVAGVVSIGRDDLEYARILAEAGLRVVVPSLVDRQRDLWPTERVAVQTGLTNREFAHRPAFILGRTMTGYEVQKTIAAIQTLKAMKQGDAPLALMGWGDGGRIALYSAALSPAVDVVMVASAFGGIDRLWQQPLDRNLFGIWSEIGDGPLLALIAPRTVIIEPGVLESTIVPAGEQGGPSDGPVLDVQATIDQTIIDAKSLLPEGSNLQVLPTVPVSWLGDLGRVSAVPFVSQSPCPILARAMGINLANPGFNTAPPDLRTLPPSAWDEGRRQRQFQEIVDDTQWLLAESASIRDQFVSGTQPARDSADLSQWTSATTPLRETFARDVIGQFADARLPANPRTRKVFDEPAYVGYEVVLDVFPDVVAYGLLLVPKGMAEGERRPVVVAQHGLEGRPQDLADPSVDHNAYHQFGCRLAERGFIVFAPQNLYIFTDRFRVLQRKLNIIGKTLFSVIVPQHEQIVDWLATLPFVDPNRIGFYGLSYGGKSAMRIPALVDRYCLSICSADFNDWIWKNASTKSPYSYVFTMEYEIFEFNLGMTFNYAEMAGLICPRPFMVERGHHDGVAPDDRVAAEYAKVRKLYSDLKIPERTAIEFFDGPHAIHGVGTFRFLHEHLRWPIKDEPVSLE